MLGNRVLAILSKDGIQFLQMINLYRELSVEGQCEIISSEQALETVVKNLTLSLPATNIPSEMSNCAMCRNMRISSIPVCA